MSKHITSIEYVGLVWEAKEGLTNWLVYQLPNAQADILPGWLEAISGWALEYLWLLVLGVFNVHTGNAVYTQAKDLVAPGLFQFISTPTH